MTKQEEFEGLATELGAMRTLRPKDDYNRGFNEGLRTAMEMAERYALSQGMFQIEDETVRVEGRDEIRLSDSRRG